MQHVLVALQYEKSSGYSIFVFVISLCGCPLRWMCGSPLLKEEATTHLGQFRESTGQ